MTDRRKKKRYNAEYYAANKERMRERAAAYRLANPDKVKAQSAKAIATKKAERAAWNKAWLAKNKERRRAYRKAKYAANREPELEAMRAYKAENKEKIAAQQAAAIKANPIPNRHRAHMRRMSGRATPVWADETEIRRRFDWAKLLTEEFGQTFEVDHVVPLNSPIVCGLHWHGNLAVIPMSENRAKGNRRWPDMPDELRA